MTALSGNPEFDAVLDQMALLHARKNKDYANKQEPLANFILQAEMTGLSVDMVFFNALAIKMARLKELVGFGKEPVNEATEDTILDMAVYATLWRTWRARSETG